MRMTSGGGTFSPEEIKYLKSLSAVAEATAKRITVLLQCLFDRFGSVFPQCGLMVFPGVVIVSR